MVTEEGSVRPGSISVRIAIRELHHRVGASVPTEVDPAPWHDVSSGLIEMFSGGNVSAFVRRKKLEERSKFVLQRGLLSGALRAHFSDDREARDVPGWAWVAAERSEQVWFEGRLPLDVFLPDEWLRWSGKSVFLDSVAFESWLDLQALIDLDGLPALPQAYDADAEPCPVSTRLPPVAPFVTLSEAVTWIAFGISLGRDELDRAISGRSFVAGDPQVLLANAVANLALRASGAQIAMRGKYVDGDCADENKVLTEPIDPVRLEDFAQYDMLYDGLRYGTGLTWWSSNDVVDRLFRGGRTDAFRSVKVSRADLLREFPPRKLDIPTGKHFPAADSFKRDDSAPIAPWWSVNQALAWIPTRMVSLVDCIGQEESDATQELRRYIVHAGAEAQIAKSDEGRAFMTARHALWPEGGILAHAGRALLEKILTGEVRPLARENGQGRQMRAEEFAGIGERETGADWLDLAPQPLFLSTDVIAAFPLDDVADARSKASKGGRPTEHDWEAMKSLARAALEEHPYLTRSKLADSLVSEYAAKVSSPSPVKRSIERKLGEWGLGTTKPISS